MLVGARRLVLVGKRTKGQRKLTAHKKLVKPNAATPTIVKLVNKMLRKLKNPLFRGLNVDVLHYHERGRYPAFSRIQVDSLHNMKEWRKAKAVLEKLGFAMMPNSGVIDVTDKGYRTGWR